MLTIEALRSYGANVDEGLQRCMGMTEFYLKMVERSAKDTKIGELETEINAGDLDRAFETAHAMKGVFGNLALTPLYEPVCEITELLRSRTDTDYSWLMSSIKSAFEKLVSVCE